MFLPSFALPRAAQGAGGFERLVREAPARPSSRPNRKEREAILQPFVRPVKREALIVRLADDHGRRREEFRR